MKLLISPPLPSTNFGFELKRATSEIWRIIKSPAVMTYESIGKKDAGVTSLTIADQAGGVKSLVFQFATLTDVVGRYPKRRSQ